MKVTHAIVVRIPDLLKFDDKKLAAKIDMPLARKQQQEFNDTLREAGVVLIELPIDENSIASNLFVDDAAVVINGTALFTRNSKRVNATAVSLRATLEKLAWDVVEAPLQEHGKNVVLDGSDVLYTGREIFVGIRKNGTNLEGALVVARVFVDLPVIPIPLSGNSPLKYYVSIAADDILTVSKSKESQSILHRIERDATFRYKIVTLDSDDCVNCLNVNGRLIFRPDASGTKFGVLQQAAELWGVTTNELMKIGAPLTRYALLVNKLKLVKPDT